MEKFRDCYSLLVEFTSDEDLSDSEPHLSPSSSTYTAPKTRSARKRPLQNPINPAPKRQSLSNNLKLNEPQMLINSPPQVSDECQTCGVVNNGDMMVACDRCGQWWYYKCIGFVGNSQDEYVCALCSNKNKTKSVENSLRV